MNDSPVVSSVRQLDPVGAYTELSTYPDAQVAVFLAQLGPARAAAILERFPDERRLTIARAAAASQSDAFEERHHYPEASIGRLLDRAPAVFRVETRVQDCTRVLRDVVKQVLVTYIFVVDLQSRLQGIVTFRDLLFAQPTARLDEIMLRDPFTLSPTMPLLDAMHTVVTRHYPVYPVCNENNVLLGIVRGPELFEEQAFQISAQAGAMVGVDLEERLATPWSRSFKMRHPWLQLNLLTAFAAGAVVSFFQDTVNALVLLAVFLPVLAGQCGNTGSQAMAVVLRGMTLGEARAKRWGLLLGQRSLARSAQWFCRRPDRRYRDVCDGGTAAARQCAADGRHHRGCNDDLMHDERGNRCGSAFGAEALGRRSGDRLEYFSDHRH